MAGWGLERPPHPALITVTMTINIDNIEVDVVHFDESSSFAICNLDFGDFVINGFRVQKSKFSDKGDKWVVPPSYQDRRGKFHRIVFFHNDKLWSELQERVMTACKAKYEEVNGL